MKVVNRTGVQGAIGFLVSSELAGSAGMTDHKGYEVRSGDLPRSAESVATTTIYSDPSYEAEARRVKTRVLPSAEIRVVALKDDVVLRIVVGEDYLENAPNVEPFVALDQFMNARFGGVGAESLLTEEALRIYRQGPDGLSLYDYTTDRSRYDFGSYRSNGGSLSAVIDIATPGRGVVREKLELKKDYPAGRSSGPTTQVVVFARRTR